MLGTESTEADESMLQLHTGGGEGGVSIQRGNIYMHKDFLCTTCRSQALCGRVIQSGCGYDAFIYN